MATLLIGYDVESSLISPGNAAMTCRFLDAMERVHTRHGAPCTLFVLGGTLDLAAARFRVLATDSVWDVQQHTYGHVRFKTVVEERPDGTSLFLSGTLEEIRQDVRRANDAMVRVLGYPAVGVAGPFAYYRGLMDRCEVLGVLQAEGLRFVRTYGRNAQDWQPVPLEVQPFRYTLQGYPEMLEIPIQQWQDCLWRRTHGFDDLAGYRRELRRCVDEAVGRDAVWGYCAHDWSSLERDPNLSLIDDLLGYARASGMRILSYREFYQEQARAAEGMISPPRPSLTG